MARRPEKFLIRGQKVLDEIKQRAPDKVKRDFANLVAMLEAGPYPDQMANCTEARGFDHDFAFIAWYGISTCCIW